MSKNVKSTNDDGGLPGISWGYAYVLNENSPDYLIGNIMPIIEIMGLADKQEEALKSQIKQIIREHFSQGVYIKPERHNEIRKVWQDTKDNCGNMCPIGAI